MKSEKLYLYNIEYSFTEACIQMQTVWSTYVCFSYNSFMQFIFCHFVHRVGFSNVFFFNVCFYYSLFTMFHQFLLYSKVTQLYIHIHFFPQIILVMSHHKWLDIVPCAIQQDPIVHPLKIQQSSSTNHRFPTHPTPSFFPWQTQVCFPCP